MVQSPPLSVQGPFELSGGNLCLDFVNTWGDRPRPEQDHMQTFSHLLAFARQTGLVDAEEAEALESQAESPEAARALQTAHALRDALYGLFSARARGRVIPAQDLACLNALLQEALPNLCVTPGEGALAWSWRKGARPLTWPLWPIARAAADLLTDAAAAPVRECDGAQCTWLFLDQSRGRSRRWCSMASCGNRAKARRHYHRGRTPGA